MYPMRAALEALWKAGKGGGGPFIGPRGGKWADPEHTIPWEEPAASEQHAANPGEWDNVKGRDAAVEAALQRAHGVEEVEDVLRGVKHREFAVALDKDDNILAVQNGPLTPRQHFDHENVIAVGGTAGNSTVPMPPADTDTWVVTHNHPAGSPISAGDVVAAAQAGVRNIHAVTWHGTWAVELEGKLVATNASELRQKLRERIATASAETHEALIASRGAEDLDSAGRGLTMTASKEYAHDHAAETVKRVAGSWRDEFAKHGVRLTLTYEGRGARGVHGELARGETQKSRAARDLARRGRVHLREGTGARLAGDAAGSRRDQVEKAAGVHHVPYDFHPVTVQPPQRKRAKFPFQGFIDFQGLKIDVENLAGSYREGIGADGHTWRVKMAADYGEIRGTEGVDGEPLDVYVLPNADSSLVVVVHQNDPTTGAYDEDKVVLGAKNVAEALALYRKQYDRPGFYGGHTAMPIGTFWRWVHDRDRRGEKVTKGGVMREFWIPIPRSVYERLLGLSKGAGHKYLKKVPAGVDPRTGKERWRYYYKVTDGQGHVANEDDFVKVGASFRLHDGEQEGHFHVVAVDGDQVTLKHDESGREVTMSTRELKLRLHREHARAIVDQRNKARAARMKEFEQAKKTGSPKQQERAKERARAAGAEVEPSAARSMAAGGDTYDEYKEAIDSGDRERIDALLARMRADNRIVNNKKLSESEKREQLSKRGLTQERIDKLLEQDFRGRPSGHHAGRMKILQQESEMLVARAEREQDIRRLTEEIREQKRPGGGAARMKEFEQAKKTGSPKQQDRAKERARAAGAEVDKKPADSPKPRFDFLKRWGIADEKPNETASRFLRSKRKALRSRPDGTVDTALEVAARNAERSGTPFVVYRGPGGWGAVPSTGDKKGRTPATFEFVDSKVVVVTPDRDVYEYTHQEHAKARQAFADMKAAADESKKPVAEKPTKVEREKVLDVPARRDAASFSRRPKPPTEASTRVHGLIGQVEGMLATAESLRGSSGIVKAIEHPVREALAEIEKASPSSAASLRERWENLSREAAGRAPGTGDETTVYVADADGQARPQKARYRLIEADQAIASHDPTKGFAKRKDYPEGVQERVYHRDQNEQTKVRQNAQNLRPDLVINTNPDAVNGPPLLTTERLALGGNSRVMSMQLAFAADGDAAKAYRKHLLDNAHVYGFSRGEIDGMKQPMLVREVDVPKEEKTAEGMAVLVRRYNEAFTQSMDPRTKMVAEARLLTPEMLGTLSHGLSQTGSDGEPKHATLSALLDSPDGQAFISHLGKGVFDRRNRGQYIRPDGALNEDGKRHVERLLVGRLIPDPDLLADVQTGQLQAIANAAPFILQTSTRGRDLSGPLTEALSADQYLRKNPKLGNTIDALYQQTLGDAMGGADAAWGKVPRPGPEGRIILQAMRERGGERQFQAFFREVARRAEQNPVNQGGLFGEAKTTRALLAETLAAQSAKGKVKKSLGPAASLLKAWLVAGGLDRLNGGSYAPHRRTHHG